MLRATAKLPGQQNARSPPCTSRVWWKCPSGGRPQWKQPATRSGTAGSASVPAVWTGEGAVASEVAVVK